MARSGRTTDEHEGEFFSAWYDLLSDLDSWRCIWGKHYLHRGPFLCFRDDSGRTLWWICLSKTGFLFESRPWLVRWSVSIVSSWKWSAKAFLQFYIMQVACSPPCVWTMLSGRYRTPYFTYFNWLSHASWLTAVNTSKLYTLKYSIIVHSIWFPLMLYNTTVCIKSLVWISIFWIQFLNCKLVFWSLKRLYAQKNAQVKTQIMRGWVQMKGLLLSGGIIFLLNILCREF